MKFALKEEATLSTGTWNSFASWTYAELARGEIAIPRLAPNTLTDVVENHNGADERV